jgi:hypothetical protein
LDGDGRRSIYVEVRRNFLSPMMQAFDSPIPFNSIGRRSVSNVPAQALIMLNDPLVKEAANRWAQRALAERAASLDERLGQLFESAFARPAAPDELSAAREFLSRQSARHATGPDDPKVWADLCHVLLNLKEFVFVE